MAPFEYYDPEFTNVWSTRRQSYEEIDKKKATTMARKRYILLKDSPEYKKGAIFEEMCDDGDQDFKCINPKDFITVPALADHTSITYVREVVLDQPEWFAELTPFYATKQQLKKIQEMLFPSKDKKTVVKKGRPRKK